MNALADPQGRGWNSFSPPSPEELPDGITWRILEMSDAERVLELRALVLAGLDDPDFYNPANETKGFVEEHLGEGGITAGIFEGQRLVAYGALGLPAPGAPNRADSLELPAEERRLVGDLASAMVIPGYRARGLHHWLIRWRNAEAIARGRIHLVTRTSPRNHFSWCHLTSHGVFIRQLLKLTPTMNRYVIHRDLRQRIAFDSRTACDCRLADIDGQEALLARGLWGIGKRQDEDGVWRAIFAAPAGL